MNWVRETGRRGGSDGNWENMKYVEQFVRFQTDPSGPRRRDVSDGVEYRERKSSREQVEDGEFQPIGNRKEGLCGMPRPSQLSSGSSEHLAGGQGGLTGAPGARLPDSEHGGRLAKGQQVS